MYSPLTKLCSWLVFSLILFSVSIRICTTLDSITPSRGLGDGDTLVSPDTNFELGFFTLTDPNRRYLGIWFNNISPRTYVWVANREHPLPINASPTLNINDQGNLVLVDFRNVVFWSSNTSIRTGQVLVAVAQLLNTGNFVVRDSNGSNLENFLWQSFDFPGNTLLPGMKLGADLERGVNRFLTAWKSTEDPATNGFSFKIDLRGYPQLVVEKGSNIIYRPGSWNGVRFTGAYIQRPNPIFTNEFVINKSEVYYKYELKNRSTFATWILNPTGLVQRFVWSYERNDWMTVSTAPIDQCENYGFCGAFASCSSAQCFCVDGFIPKSQSHTNAGCKRRIPLNCSITDGFVTLKGIKLPDTSSSWYDTSIDLAQCRKFCLTNCSCTAYATLNITGGGSGCLQWGGDLIDLRTLPENGQEIYVRLSASELGGRRSYLKVAIIAGSATLSVIIVLLFLYIRRRQIRQYVMSKRKRNYYFEGRKEEMELPLFSLMTICEATNDFSSNNKLGEGGFGPVYKGRLIDGQEIAVKRLSKSSGQGLKELENEVKLIAKLQHRNLVKLLGCCIHEDEKLLIYEYMPNRSLDFFIFDETRSKFLDWQKRLHIIDGIARGLVYLHQDSRLKIIHRDLKTSNILLDGNMNPKISDFGLARLFDVDQSEANTQRVAGTYGYMSPEYAVDGVLSVKSDVYSYGVMVLEIVSGKKNRGFSHPGHDLNLLGHVYMLWNEGTPMEVVDKECLMDCCSESQVVRCINIGLLCVQQRPEDRPNMGWVVVMLSSDNPLPEPKEPGFFLPRNPLPQPADSSANKDQSPASPNEVSSSLLEPR